VAEAAGGGHLGSVELLLSMVYLNQEETQGQHCGTSNKRKGRGNKGREGADLVTDSSSSNPQLKVSTSCMFCSVAHPSQDWQGRTNSVGGG
jgi:hypothetical protein